jgi:hypothetical protein
MDGKAVVVIGSPTPYGVFIKTVKISIEVHKPRWSTMEMPRSSQIAIASFARAY